MATTTNSPNATPIWRFWVPLLFQTVLILTVPAQAVYTQLTGKTVILQTVPIDPYELLRGYSQTLRYDISSQDNLRKLPGWQSLPKQQPDGNTRDRNKLTLIESGTRFYVILKAPAPSASTEVPQAWKPVAVSLQRPSQLPTNQVALEGIARSGSVEYGLETYYIPEDQRQQINADLSEARSADSSQSPKTQASANSTQIQQKPPVVMEIKVDAQGNAVPISLWARIGKASPPKVRNYRF